MIKKRKSRPGVRSSFLWLHRWLGLISGLVVLVVSLTGCLYVFEKEWRNIFQHTYYFVKESEAPRKSITELQATVTAAYPCEKITFIRFKEKADAAFIFSTKSRKAISINPYTAAIIGERDMENDFFAVVLRLHRTLLLGETGKEIIKWNVLIFFILCISGLILWWPKQKKFFKQAVNINFKTKNWKRFNWDMHSVLGFYALLLLFLISLTGLFFVFDSVKDMVRFATNEPKLAKEQKIKSVPAIAGDFSLDKAYNLALATCGKGTDVFITLPADSIAPLRIAFQYPYTIVRKQNTLLYDRYSGKLLKETLYKNYTAYEKVSRSNYQLHTGDMPGLGIGTKLIYFLASLIAASLPVTGFLIWIGRKKKGKKKKLLVKRVIISKPAELIEA